MIRAVLDTNVLISALFWRGAPHRVVQRGLGGDFVILISRHIVDETLRKLVSKFVFPFSDALEYIETIVVNARLIDQVSVVRVVAADPADNAIVACAVDGNADYIVTGDQDILSLKQFRSIRMITPNSFLKLLV